MTSFVKTQTKQIDETNMFSLFNRLVSFNRPRGRIAYQMLFLMGLLISLPVIIVSYIGFTRLSDEIRDRTLSQLESVAELKHSNIRRWLQNSQTTLDLMLNDAILNQRLADVLTYEGDWGGVLQILNDYINERLLATGIFNRVYIYDRQGDIILSSDPMMLGQNMLNESFFVDSLQGRTIHRLPFNGDTPNLIIEVSRPIKNDEGITVGVIVGELGGSELKQILTDYSGMGRTGDTHLIDTQHQVMLSPSRERPNQAFEAVSLSDSLLLVSVDKQPVKLTNVLLNHQQTYGLDNVLLYAKWVPELSALLVAEMSTEEGYHTLKVLRNFSILLAGVTVFFTLLVARMYVRALIRPLEEMTKAALNLTKGNYEQLIYATPPKNEVGTLILAFNDMSEQLKDTFHAHQQAEQELREALDKERELGEMKSNFVLMASHEFRTPLATIRATSETLMNYWARMNDDQRNTRFETVIQQVEHMTRMLDDFLMMGRMEAKKVQVIYQPMYIEPYLRNLRDELQVVFNKHTLQFFSHIDEHLTIDADEMLVRQMVSNLISNAVKYSPEGSKVDLMLDRDNRYIYIEVTDRGIGIPLADQKHLFEAFHRAKNVRTISGTGLGLAITKRAVDFHHGDISFSSIKDEGTTFQIKLPIRQTGD